MNRSEAADFVQTLLAAYPNFTAEHDTGERWVQLFMELQPDLAAEAIERWAATEGFWPSEAGFRKVVHEIDREWRLAIAAPASAKCDGSGWIPRGDGRIAPCPSCNPWVVQVFADSTKFALWQSGVKGWLIEHVSERVWREQWARPRCKHVIVEDYTDPPTALPRGREIAAAAYAEACRERGREPDWRTFERLVGGRVIELGGQP